MVYNNWKKYLNTFIQINPLELAGRGKRFKTPLYDNFDKALSDLYDLIKNEIDGERYALFGHSLGGLLACELAFKLSESGNTQPTHLFISGMYPLHIKCKTSYHQMPYEEFKREINGKDSFEESIFKDQRLADIFLPILQTDYKIMENYQYVPKSEKLNCNLTVMGCENDRETVGNDFLSWRQYTNKEVDFHEFEGGHFFINEKMQEVISLVNRTLSQYMDEESDDESIIFG